MVDTTLPQDKGPEGSSNDEVNMGVNQNSPPPEQVNEPAGVPTVDPAQMQYF